MKTSFKGLASRLAFSLFLLAGFGLIAASAQEASSGGASSGDDSLFGAEEVSQAAPATDAPKNNFLKYDQVKIGGQITSSAGAQLLYLDPWSGSQDLFAPDSTTLVPALSGRLTLVAKPVEEFGVNGEVRFSYPFTTTTSYISGAAYIPGASPLTSTVKTTSGSLSTTNLTIRSFYAKFNVKDVLFMSFGKQPIAWGVSKGFFQPADDIFALSTVDYSDTSAEREGPLAFKAMYTVPLTMTNFYFYAGLPPATSSSESYKFEDLRLALKGEFNVGNTEAAFGAFYGYNDHPRVLAMATTGIGLFNFFGEAIGKYGSERYFIDKNGSDDVTKWTAAKRADQLYFNGTLGGYYTDSNSNVTILGQVYYNGEAQSGVSAQDAYTYYLLHTSQADSLRLSPWYAGISLSKAKLFTDDLSVALYAVSSLSDFSGMVVPSVSYAFTDYSSVKLSATFTFGAAGDEFIINGADMGYIAGHYALLASSTPSGAFDKNPGAAVSLTFTLGTGTF
jgi:hypothetical protein